MPATRGTLYVVTAPVIHYRPLISGAAVRDQRKRRTHTRYCGMPVAQYWHHAYPWATSLGTVRFSRQGNRSRPQAIRALFDGWRVVTDAALLGVGQHRAIAGMPGRFSACSITLSGARSTAARC